MCLLDNCQISSMSDKYPTAFKVAYYHKGFQQNKIFIQVRCDMQLYEQNKKRSRLNLHQEANESQKCFDWSKNCERLTFLFNFSVTTFFICCVEKNERASWDAAAFWNVGWCTLWVAH